MKKNELKEKVDIARTNTRDALQTVYDALNAGQKKKIIKNENVKQLFDLYKVDY